MGTGSWAPPGGGGIFGKRIVLPFRLPLEIRNHDCNHLVKNHQNSQIKKILLQRHHQQPTTDDADGDDDVLPYF